VNKKRGDRGEGAAKTSILVPGKGVRGGLLEKFYYFVGGKGPRCGIYNSKRLEKEERECPTQTHG